MKIDKTKQKGFTLIEAVVSAGVFAVVVTSAVGVYLSTLQLDAKTKAERAVQQNARFIMEFLGKEIGNGAIDYARYGTDGISASGSDHLLIVNQALEKEHVYYDATSKNLVLSKTEGTTNLNSSKVRVTKLAFLLSPATDPFASLSSSPPNIQPNVTVILELTSDYGNRGVNKAVMNLESNFAVRQYPSRDY